MSGKKKQVRKKQITSRLGRLNQRGKNHKSYAALSDPQVLIGIEDLLKQGTSVAIIAKSLDVSTSAIYKKLRKNKDVVVRAKVELMKKDQKVVKALYERATGTFISKEKRSSSDGSETLIERQHPPDAACAIYWTKARLGWSDKGGEDSGVAVNIVFNTPRPSHIINSSATLVSESEDS